MSLGAEHKCLHAKEEVTEICICWEIRDRDKFSLQLAHKGKVVSLSRKASLWEGGPLCQNVSSQLQKHHNAFFRTTWAQESGMAGERKSSRSEAPTTQTGSCGYGDSSEGILTTFNT